MSQAISKNGRTLKLRDSVEQVWLAGLGALAVTEEEGNKLFKSLVKRGEGFEKDTKVQIKKAVSAAKSVAKQVPGNAMTAIESGIDDTMNGVLNRLGVPTKREINNLTRRVEGLASTLESKTKRARPATRAKAPMRPRRKVNLEASVRAL